MRKLLILLCVVAAGCATTDLMRSAEDTGASKTVSSLDPFIGTPAGTEELFINDSGTSKRMTTQQQINMLQSGMPSYEIAAENLPVKQIIVSLDPGANYDIDAEVPILTVGDNFPYGMAILEWKTACNTASPSPEINADLRYADSFTTYANPNDIDELDTSSGVSSESTPANINSGNAVANGKVIYIGFDADPEGTCTSWTVELWVRAEEQ